MKGLLYTPNPLSGYGYFNHECLKDAFHKGQFGNRNFVVQLPYLATHWCFRESWGSRPL